MASYATERKIKIIEGKLGPNWESQLDGRSIDRLYTELVGDNRKNLFCKISPECKAMLDELSKNKDMKLSELLEIMVSDAHKSYRAERDEIGKLIRSQLTV